MTDSIALVGRTNVGKSLLFNKLVQYKNSIVLNKHGVTRDVNQGKLLYEDKYLNLYDTAGITSQDEQFSKLAYEKTLQAINKSSVVLFVTSLEDGVTSSDKEICSILRKLNKEIILVINKSDKQKSNLKKYEFSELGFSNSFEVSAKTNKGLFDLIKKTFALANSRIYTEVKTNRIAFIGKPNVGKSTLINSILNESRSITSDTPGTTIDSLEIPFTFKDKNYLIYDTAGIMKKSSTKEIINKYSINMSLKCISDSNICVLVISASDLVSKQDKNIFKIIKENNKPFILVINKIDLVNKNDMKKLRSSIDYFSNILFGTKIIYLSALENRNIRKLLFTIKGLVSNLHKEYRPSKLTKILNDACNKHPVKNNRNRLIKLKFAKQNKSSDLSISIHGNQTDKIPDSYRKYLVNYFSDQLGLSGVPIRLIFKKEKNPYDMGSNLKKLN
jgi:GTP-binding protein